MATAIYMPKQGMSMDEGTLVRWLKKVGDKVELNEPVMEIETDKITMEAEAPASGVILAELVEEGAVVPVLQTIGWIGAEGEKVPESEATAAAAPAAAEAAPAASAGNEYTVAVIGGGPAGYCAAIRAAQLGGKVILFERRAVGGTCLNRGCIPTKTFVKTGEAIHSFKTAGERGVVFSADVTASVDMPKVVEYKNNVVKKLTGGVSGLLRSNGVKVVEGEAKLADAHTIECGGEKFAADNIILCGGSKVTMIPIEGIDNKKVITSDELLDIDHVPGKLVIIGGGIVGCEFAQPFSHFGSEVTLVEAMDRLTPALDPELSAGIEKGLAEAGVKVLTSRKVEKIYDKDDKTYVTVSGEDYEADTILLCVGRSPVADCLGALEGQIEMNGKHVKVDDYCRTSLSNVYACGDITDRSGLASSAMKMGEIAAENAMGGEKVCDLSRCPNIIHTFPEAVSIGMSETDAKAQYGEDLLIGKFPFGGNGMCLAAGMTDGFVKVLAEKNYGEILGVHILGGDAAEMAAEAVDLMSMEISVYEASEIIHAHPTMSEAFMEACADALGRSIHLPKKKKK